uniref:Fibronectin type-III domain-containing protein n=1 Tax=Timema douglasi TaxID=61478 RepID=A0A7R8VSU0_TIMDO|nr:unnamed protein product [Timema douglasi]
MTALTPDSISSLETRSAGPSVIVTWSPPSEHPRCAEQYEICWEASLDDWNCTVQDSSVTTLYITDLNYCSEYLVGVRALGRPDNSSRVNATATTGPEGVSRLKAVNNSVSSIAVQWEPPSNTDCLEEYQVCWSLADGTQSNCTTQTIQELETMNITGLTGCTNYIINVTSVGPSSDYSETVSIATSTVLSKQFLLQYHLAPQRVKRVQVYSAYATNITVVWQLPSHTQCLQGLRVCLSPRDGNQSDCTIQSSHAHAAWTFTELTPCSSYLISVATVGSSGDYSEAVTVSAESACDLQDHGMRLGSLASFLTNQYPPKCVEQYEICWGSSQDDQNCTVQDSSFTTLDITELTYCSEYLAWVTTLRRPGNSRRVNAAATVGPRPAHNLTFLSAVEAANAAVDCVDYYRVCLKVIGDEMVCVSQMRDGTIVRIPDLLSCTSYTFNATARTEGGGRSVLSEQVNTRAAEMLLRYVQEQWIETNNNEHNMTFTMKRTQFTLYNAATGQRSNGCLLKKLKRHHPIPRLKFHSIGTHQGGVFVEYPDFTNGNHQLVIYLSDTYKMEGLRVGEHIHVTAEKWTN